MRGFTPYSVRRADGASPTDKTIMRVTSSPSALLRASLQIAPVCLLASATAAHAQSVQDFQLPPSATPTPTPNVQGPVDPDAPQTRPRPVNTPTPTPSPSPLPTPSPAVTATPTPSPTARRTPTPTPTATARPNASAPVQQGPTPVPTPAPALPAEQELPETPSPAITQSGPTAAAAPSPAATAPAGEDAPGKPSFPLYWIGALIAVLVLLGGALVWRRRRMAAPPPTIAPPIAPSLPNREPADTGEAATQAQAAEPLSLRFEALKLTRSMMFATLHYRVTVINRTNKALHNVTTAIDLTSAHANLPTEQQVASENTPLDIRHTSARLAANQSARFEGEVQLPLAQANVVRQGAAALLIPLVRLRVAADDAAALVKTFVTGQASAVGSARLQPFRLDDGPRSFQPLSQRALD